MENQQEELTQEQVFDIIEFAEALYGMGKNKQLFEKIDYYNTDLVNQKLKDLNNNPKVPTLEAIERALKNYVDNEENLQSYSEYMYFWDTIYQKSIDYLDNILAFDLSKYCINIKNPEKEYKSKAYKDDEARVYKFFNKFNYKQEFKKIVHNMLLDDACFAWLRDSQGSYNDEVLSLEDDYKIKKSQRFALQLMPQQYCKITGTDPDGFLWDFDLNYFTMPTISINNYDPSLKKALNSRIENQEMKSFILDNKDLNKTNGYGTDGWTRTNRNDGAWCFKMNMSNYVQVPHFSPLMRIVFNNDIIAKLQKDKDIASAYALLVGEMKMLKEQQAREKDAFAINPKTLGTMLKMIQSGLRKNVRPISLPLEETKFMQFNDNSPRMAMNQYKTSASNGVSASNLIFADDKMGQFEVQSALMIDYNFMAQLYLQFENFLNFFVNKKTKKYKFKFVLKGSNFAFERQNRIDNVMRLADKGITVNTSTMASTFGFGMQEFQAMLEESKYGGWTEDLTVMLENANTMSSKDVANNNNGRPQKEVNELTQSGENSRNYS